MSNCSCSSATSTVSAQGKLVVFEAYKSTINYTAAITAEFPTGDNVADTIEC